MLKFTGIPSEALITATKGYLKAKYEADAIRPIITGIQADILKQYNFNDIYENNIISDPKLAYCMSEADAEIYFKVLHEAYIDAGYTYYDGLELEFGYCPLLLAENKLIYL